MLCMLLCYQMFNEVEPYEYDYMIEKLDNIIKSADAKSAAVAAVYEVVKER